MPFPSGTLRPTKHRNITESLRTGTSAGVSGLLPANSGGSGISGHSLSHSARDETRPGGKRAPHLFKSGGGASVPGATTAAAASAVGGGRAGASAVGPVDPPVEYTMLLHPPLIVENLLPHAGDFELVDQVRLNFGHAGLGDKGSKFEKTHSRAQQNQPFVCVHMYVPLPAAKLPAIAFTPHVFIPSPPWGDFSVHGVQLTANTPRAKAYFGAPTWKRELALACIRSGWILR